MKKLKETLEVVKRKGKSIWNVKNSIMQYVCYIQNAEWKWCCNQQFVPKSLSKVVLTYTVGPIKAIAKKSLPSIHIMVFNSKLPCKCLFSSTFTSYFIYQWDSRVLNTTWLLLKKPTVTFAHSLCEKEGSTNPGGVTTQFCGFKD